MGPGGAGLVREGTAAWLEGLGGSRELADKES